MSFTPTSTPIPILSAAPTGTGSVSVAVSQSFAAGTSSLVSASSGSYGIARDYPAPFNHTLGSWLLDHDPVIQALKKLPSTCLYIGDGPEFIRNNGALYLAAKQVLEIAPEELPRLLTMVPESEQARDPLWNLAQRRLYGND